jgi:hypothetical protein
MVEAQEKKMIRTETVRYKVAIRFFPHPDNICILMPETILA